MNFDSNDHLLRADIRAISDPIRAQGARCNWKPFVYHQQVAERLGPSYARALEQSA